MALKKELVFTNGVKIGYHKIDNIEYNNGNIKITVKSYTDESYRESEKANNKIKSSYEAKLAAIVAENTKGESARDAELIKILSDECNTLVNEFTEMLDLSVLSATYEYKDISDLSFGNLYGMLKQLNEYKDSEDV